MSTFSDKLEDWKKDIKAHPVAYTCVLITIFLLIFGLKPWICMPPGDGKVAILAFALVWLIVMICTVPFTCIDNGGFIPLLHLLWHFPGKLLDMNRKFVIYEVIVICLIVSILLGQVMSGIVFAVVSFIFIICFVNEDWNIFKAFYSNYINLSKEKAKKNEEDSRLAEKKAQAEKEYNKNKRAEVEEGFKELIESGIKPAKLET